MTFDLAQMIADREVGTPGDKWMQIDASLYPDCVAADINRDNRVPAMEDEIIRLTARVAELEGDKSGLQAQAGKLLSMLDNWDTARAAETGGHTMHVYGMTPDWFVEAAHWVCYGYSYQDPRAALSTHTEEIKL